MSNSFSGFGTQLQLGDGGTPIENFTSISEIQKVDFTGSKVDIIDVTHMQSPAARREYLATLIDSGEVSFDANFIPTDLTQAQLQAVMDARKARNWKVVLPNTLGTFSFAGIVTSLDRNLTFDKEAKLTGKIKITGTIAFA